MLSACAKGNALLFLGYWLINWKNNGGFYSIADRTMSMLPADGDSEQQLADEVDHGAGRVDCQQNAEEPQDREWLLVEVLQVE